MEPFTAVEIIREKRDGGELSPDRIDWIVDAYTRGVVAEEQMSALAMAIYLNGMTAAETARWTAAMVDSGERLSLPKLVKPLVDKHSTGGVGDKITLPLGPLLAHCGAAVPQLSGRGLGHTGGTLDKLESVPGWRAGLSAAEIASQLAEIGAVVAAATPTLAPADRKLYALRDVTATVESIPLIASSIMSKKIAEGTSALVLDVKVGSGAFMKDLPRARELAETLVSIGAASGVRTTAVLSDMSAPIGYAIGNAVEVAESVEVLRGGGPADVVELTTVLAEEMLRLAGLSADPAGVLASGAAYQTWRAMLRAQDGDPDAPLPAAAHVRELTAPADGYLAELDAYSFGVAAWRLGAGRTRKEDPVQHAAGIVLNAKRGAWVRAGEPLAWLHTDTEEAIEPALAELEGAVTVTATEPEPRPLIIDVLRG
ncbi:thymidine phosphorylase [Sciscionella sediminilitoris]|uniref:thymidine phosphorylase n=1 Tax=Sciscionella sediminilitoris TaxID=1445613 RepID=UPI0004DF9FF0|nr:thymidine phosphorylase [Sciscionella sp. SE31]